jgi:hypothetical protein
MPISHRVRQLHPELFTEAIVLHARQGDRGLSLADSGGLDIEGERGRSVPHRCSGNTSLALRAAAGRHSGCAGRRNCNVNLDDLDQDRPDLNCEPLQAPGTARNLQLDETGAMLLCTKSRPTVRGYKLRISQSPRLCPETNQGNGMRLLRSPHYRKSKPGSSSATGNVDMTAIDPTPPSTTSRQPATPPTAPTDNLHTLRLGDTRGCDAG